MKLIGLDVGTTNCKAGLFNEKGELLKICKQSTISHKTDEGYSFYQPQELWKTVINVLKNVITGQNKKYRFDWYCQYGRGGITG